MQNWKERKEFSEKIKNIYISRHAIKSWKEISWNRFQELPRSPEKEIIEMLKQAREVEHNREIYKDRERIVYGQPARHFKFKELMMVVDQKLTTVITIFPIFHAQCWRRRGARRKRRRKGT